MTLTAFNTKTALFDAAYDDVCAGLKTALAARGTATLLLSGGSTPAPLYAALSEADLDWAHVTVGLVDDRWVAPTDDASNERLVRSTLLRNRAQQASFIPMKTNAATPHDAAHDRNAAYAPFESPDVVILGMGPDGHTASWFPGAVDLSSALDPDTKAIVTGIDATGCPVAGVHIRRMTVTLPPIARAAQITLLMTGEDKRTVYENTDANLPIHLLLGHASNPLRTLWAP